jgi:hypothetical protein
MARRIDVSQLNHATVVSGASRAQLVALLIRVERMNIELLCLYEEAYDDVREQLARSQGAVWDWLFAHRFALVERARELRRVLVRHGGPGAHRLQQSVRVDVAELVSESAAVDAGEAWVLKAAVRPLPLQPASEGGPSPGREASGSRLR